MEYPEERTLTMDEVLLAMDMGGTQLRFALLDSEFRFVARYAEATRPEQGPQQVLERIVARLKALGDQVGWEKIQAVGVAAPGPLDPFRGVILHAPNLPGWRDVPVAEHLRQALGCPVLMGNDANLGALAEQRRGAGRGHADVVYVTVSTGIGGGVISGGRLVWGHQGLAGEVGHMTLEPHGPPCNCGNRGCLEALASGTAIGQQAQQLVRAGARTLMADLAGGDAEHITAELVHEAADRGDAVAVDLFRQAGRYLGIGLANLMNLLNPSMIVVGGSVTKAGQLLFVPMQAAIRERAYEVLWRDCPVVPAALGGDVGLIGAALWARESMSGEGAASR
jgi:glucokinase